MYDPSTVAHEIKFPWGHRFGKHFYRSPFITIWHEDPEIPGRGRRTDDSCGWFHPPTTKQQREEIAILGKRQYSTIFGKQHAIAEGKGYAYLSYEPSTYDAIYWGWRAIKFSKTAGWQYGDRRRPLTDGELDAIYRLASNPVDNLRQTVAHVKDEDTCADFFLTLYSCFLRHYRPWYKHPRWHFWHWRFQIHPWQNFRRWMLTRCATCGKPFKYGESPVSNSWDSPPLKFMRGEPGLRHTACCGHSPASAEPPPHD